VEPNRFVSLGTTARFVAMIAAALLLVPRASRGSAHDLSLLMLASTMAAPIAWEHHYGVLAPMLAAAWPWLAARRPFGRIGGVAFGGATLLAANYIPAANWFDGAPLSPVQSYLLFAACVLWVLMLRATLIVPRAAEPGR
jgi:alpha-1,2-mannosyltransferase